VSYDDILEDVKKIKQGLNEIKDRLGESENKELSDALEKLETQALENLKELSKIE